MSYDLNFWRYKPGVTLNHESVYQRLSDGCTVDGLADLPITQILARVHEVFLDWERVDDVTFDGGERGGFQLYTTPQFFRVDCYGMDGEEMNRLIDIAHDFQCPLYDPQVGRRFDSA